MAKHLSLICVCFLSELAWVPFVAQRHPEHSIWAAEPMLLIVLAILLIHPPLVRRPNFNLRNLFVVELFKRTDTDSI